MRPCAQVLDLSGNQVEGVREAEHLMGLPVLTSLDLTGNPVTEKEFYRLRVLVRLQQLASLDQAPVEAPEKVRKGNVRLGAGC
jgi:Leucine-rich repeat (LRR) protein